MPRDAFRFINDLDDATVETLAARLEFRGKDPTFTQWREAYLDRLTLPPGARVLDVGCGTGVVARGIAARPGFAGQVVGQDQSPRLVEAARRLAAEEDVDDRVAFEVGDAEALPYPNAAFDAVVAHTTISHVGDPLALLTEAARVVRPTGRIAVFDGDYASWTFDHPDPVFAKAMDEAIIAAVVNNPRVLRELPRLLREAGLEREDLLAWVYADVGAGRFYGGAIEAYAPLVVRTGLLAADRVDEWLAHQREAMAEGIFFGACNYYAYVVRRAA
jgi:ubiquinone/menaquinone biosynthesis C-methylase UbiE